MRKNPSYTKRAARGGLGLALGLLATTQAQAAELASAANAGVVSTAGCSASRDTIAGNGAQAQLAPASKAGAIVGGGMSELERISLAQQAAPAATVALGSSAPFNIQLQPVSALSPAAGPLPQQAGCLQWARPIYAVPTAPAQASSGDIFASKRLAIGHTAFDGEWNRVRGDRVSRTRYRRLLGAVPVAPETAVARVNAWVNRSITYVEDQQLFGRADYWAGATKTLRLREGDCEDIALTKMQLLAAAGIPRDDMILTIARDLVRGADHAVLIVKLDGRYQLLDNATDAVLDATAAADYRPVLSFGEHQAWLHGYQTAAVDASALGQRGPEGLAHRLE